MLLLYRRGTKECRLETSYDESTRQYTLIIHRDPHERQIEKFPRCHCVRSPAQEIGR